ncbi:hypothetical protein X560_2204 [Listeria fleischmannii 1991]|jgi:predicted phosphate transport protein (TIGR00153 family)|uniref:Phosphate transport regulator (Distant homolog of PhoU) n=3 Tax=Listeria fleischmannii TaxID=1069827 RepID=A0A2X3J354_9LIST|nr:DUF47 domain-containing protein [Listeria fleischmannii]KMT58378.1 hypothetical protein X560_2204 [Listeria fleischmannii 1991]MBC1397711.1 DUF47 domain-containing protein [Listeria fleischmannii]MBC1417639.1 DUF47 domain-containing protein [Listeria fleischmannii]MBC1426748.1 DUF47 domain-containing protein [Listeria fleischmannii]SQC68510.1 Phosphate transport regulator (distant homolog of PhoU) [Listeria fleischmannii subsp. fleischmannii]
MAFKNKKDRFASLLHDIAVNLHEGANFFASYNISSVEDLHTFSDKMKEYETTGDTMVHKMIMELNDAFITPIEREDMLELTNRLDDVMDGLEQTAFSLEICQITRYDDYMLKFIEAIQKSTVEIEKAVDLVFDKKLKDVRKLAIQIKDYESKCDEVYRESLIKLFQEETDAVKIIRKKEVYENLEEIADNCQSVANTLESIVMKNA